MSPPAFDVLLVGYGPVGQTLSLLLGRQGQRVGVIERYPTLYNLPRAVHFDHEVGRIFQSGGIADAVRAVSEGTPPGVFEYLNAKREVISRLPVGGAGQSGWAFGSAFAQQHLEAVIDAAVGELPSVEMFRGWECVDLSQDANQVTVGIRSTDDGSVRNLSARYVVGVDGANSFVRRSLAVEETDLGFASDWLVVSIVYKPDTARVGMMQICDPARSVTVAPGGPDRQRFEFMLRPDETPAEMSTPEVAWSLLAEFGLTPETAELERHAVYRFGARWANDWRHGRVLLAGDAAHVMPPFRGQGMCSGIRDAAALAWRLSLVLSGRAPDGLLDSYASERIPHVVDWIRQAVQIGEIICISDPVAAAQRDAFMAAMAANPALAPPMPAPPKLGPGIAFAGDAHAGKLGFQGIVEVGGVRGLLDDIVGGGFSLVGTTIDPAKHLSPENRAWFESLPGTIAQVGGDAIVDVEGGYAGFFDSLGVGVILSRPDFHIFGTATDAAQVDLLVSSLRAQLGMAVDLHDPR